MHAARFRYVFFIGLALLLVGDPGRRAPSPAATATPASLDRALAKQPLRFEENVGQVDANVRYVARRGDASLFLAQDGATLLLGARTTLKLTVAGAKTVQPTASSLLPTKTNYLFGRDRSKWNTNVASYGRVTYPDVLDGVDLVYHGEDGQLEYDFVVAPGRDPASIAMTIEGSDGLSLTETGELAVSVPGGSVVQQRPRVFQRDGQGTPHDVKAKYRLAGPESVGFEVASYDHARALVIDPVIGYSTYLGNTGADIATAVAADDNGNAYITGSATVRGYPNGPSNDIPPATPLSAGGSSSTEDFFVAELLSNGQLAYVTYGGGSGADETHAIALAGARPIVSGGTTSSDFPTTQGPSGPTGASDAFVLELDDQGLLAFATLIDIGSRPKQPASDVAYGIVVDRGIAYLAGKTVHDPGYSVLTGGGDNVAQVSVPEGDAAFFCEANSGRNGIYYALGDGPNDIGKSCGFGILASVSCLCGTNNGYGNEACTNKDRYGSGHCSCQASAARTCADDGQSDGCGGTIAACVNGGRCRDNSTGSGFTCGPGGGAFVASLVIPNGATATTLTSRILGGDEARALALDGEGLYVVGTSCNDEPTLVGSSDGGYQTASPRNCDAFLVKVDPVLFGNRYATYLGGANEDRALGVAVGATGQAYVTGFTSSYEYETSAGFPTRNAYQSANADQQQDAFVAHIDTRVAGTNSLAYSTYLGGTGNDQALGIGLDALGHAYVTGWTQSSQFPTTTASVRATTRTDKDAFVTELSADGSSLIDSSYFGGSFDDIAYGIAVRATGLYFVGSTQGQATVPMNVDPQTGFDITGARQPNYGGGATDGFVVKIGAEPLVITPADVTVAAGGMQSFIVSGGVGAGYQFTLATNTSGATIDPATGAYVAGTTAGTDIVRVNDIAGNGAAATVHVTAPTVSELGLSPTRILVFPRGSVEFTATDGTPPYSFALQTNGSGGRVSASGAYLAGSRGNVSDVVRVTDSGGQTKTALVVVGPPITVSPSTPQVAPRATVVFTASGGSHGNYVWSSEAGAISEEGVFTAPPSAGVVAVHVRDNLGNEAVVNVSVGGALAISPADPSSYPKGTIAFTAFGGSKSGYHWADITSPEVGGAIDVATGIFIAGPSGNVTESIEVADSTGNRAVATITVGPGLSILPGALGIAANGQIAFSAAGGSGNGYTFSIESSASGASINPTGVYTAGALGGTDVVRLVDSVGNIARATITAAATGPTATGGSTSPEGASASAPQVVNTARVAAGSSGDNGCAVTNVGGTPSPSAAAAATFLLSMLAFARRRRPTSNERRASGG